MTTELDEIRAIAVRELAQKCNDFKTAAEHLSMWGKLIRKGRVVWYENAELRQKVATFILEDDAQAFIDAIETGMYVQYQMSLIFNVLYPSGVKIPTGDNR